MYIYILRFPILFDRSNSNNSVQIYILNVFLKNVWKFFLIFCGKTDEIIILLLELFLMNFFINKLN